MILKLPYYYSMAKYRVWRKAWPSAAQNYQHLVGIVPGRQPWQYKLIELLIKSKRFREALSVAEKGLSKHPSDEKGKPKPAQVPPGDKSPCHDA